MKNIRPGIIMMTVLSLVCMIALNLYAESKAEKQEDIQKMAQQTLQQLYKAQPLAKAAIEKASELPHSPHRRSKGFALIQTG